MSGNARLSHPHEDGRPAGGFGASAPADEGIVRLSPPKPRTHIGLIVDVRVVAAAVAGLYHLALTATSPADREDLPAAVILRGRVDPEKSAIVLEPTEERARK